MPEKKLFQQPPEFLEFCKKLKVTRPDMTSAANFIDSYIHELANDWKRHQNYNRLKGRVFEYIVDGVAAKNAPDFGAQPFNANMHERLVAPYKTFKSPGHLPQSVELYDGHEGAEFDSILVNSDNLWVVESRLANEKHLKSINERGLGVLTEICENTGVSFTMVTTSDFYKPPTKFASYFGIVPAHIDVYHSEITGLIDDVIRRSLERT